MIWTYDMGVLSLISANKTGPNQLTCFMEESAGYNAARHCWNSLLNEVPFTQNNYTEP